MQIAVAVLIDGCGGADSEGLDVAELGCDFVGKGDAEKIGGRIGLQLRKGSTASVRGVFDASGRMRGPMKNQLATAIAAIAPPNAALTKIGWCARGFTFPDRLEAINELRGGLETLSRILRQRAAENRLERFGSAEWQRGWMGARYVRNQVVVRCATKRCFASEHLIENRAEAKDICTGVHGCATSLLRRHIARRAQNRSRCRVVVSIATGQPLGKLRDAEVDHFHPSIGTDNDVLRLDVAMNDAGSVCRFQRLRDLDDDIESLGARESAAVEDLAKGFALNEFRNQEVTALEMAELENGQQVGLIET